MHHLPPAIWGVENSAEAILRKGSLLAAVAVPLPSGHAAVPAWLWCVIPGINGALHFVANRTRMAAALDIEHSVVLSVNHLHMMLFPKGIIKHCLEYKYFKL